MDDRSILKLLWDRAEAAIGALAQRFGSGLYHLACNILGSAQDAEETVNDTYLAIWNAIPPERPQKLSPYVYRVGRNRALSRYRDNTAQKRNSHYDLSISELAGSLPGGSLEDTIDVHVLGQAIDSFLSRANSLNRVLFLRRYWFGDSVQDLAKAYCMTPNTISVRLSRMRYELKEYLKKEGILL